MNPKQSTRALIYRIIVAVVPALVTAGLLADGVAQTILQIAAAVLGGAASGLAAYNTPLPKSEDKGVMEVRGVLYVLCVIIAVLVIFLLLGHRIHVG